MYVDGPMSWEWLVSKPASSDFLVVVLVPDREGRPLGVEHGEGWRRRLLAALDADGCEPSEPSGFGRPDAAVSPDNRHRSGTGFPPIAPPAPGQVGGPVRRFEGCERAPGTGLGSSPAPHSTHGAEARQAVTFEPATTVHSGSAVLLGEPPGIDPGTRLPPKVGGADPQPAVQQPQCRICIGYWARFQQAAYAIKPRKAWLAQARTATAALEAPEAAHGWRITSDDELYPLDPTAFRALIEALRALEIDTGFRVPDELMTLAGLTRLDTGWDNPDRP